MDSDSNPIPDDTGDVMEEAELVDLRIVQFFCSFILFLFLCIQMFEAVPGSVWFHFSSASAASASFSSNSSSIPSSSLSVSSSSVSSSSSSVSFSSVYSSSSSGFSSYPNIENFVSVVSQIEFVDPVSVLGDQDHVPPIQHWSDWSGLSGFMILHVYCFRMSWILCYHCPGSQVSAL